MKIFGMTLFLAGFLLLSVQPGVARPLSPPATPAQVPVPAPVSARAPVVVPRPARLLRERLDRLIGFIEAGGLQNPRQLRSFIEQELAPHFDFAYMTRMVLGPRYRQLDARQRRATAAQLRSLFLEAMVRQLIAFAPSRARHVRSGSLVRNDQALLAVQAFDAAGRPNRIVFRLYFGPAGWKVYDVNANGQSALWYYRRYFASRVAAGSLYPARPLGYR